MEVKAVRFIGYSTLNIIVSEEHHFMVPANAIAGTFGLKDTKRPLDAITKRLLGMSFIEGTHYTKHEKGDVQVFKNLMPGSYYVTRVGLILLCKTIATENSELIKQWAIKHTYEAIANNGTSMLNRFWYRHLGRRDISIFGKWKKDFIWEQTQLNFTGASRAMTIVMNIYQN